MPKCNDCGNTEAFTSNHCQYSEVTIRFNVRGKIVERRVERTQCGGVAFGPWLCEVCGSSEVDLSDVVLPDTLEVA